MMALGAAAKADTITSVSCSTPTAAFQTDTAACDAIGRYGYSQASVTTGVALPASASDTAVINVNSSAAALQYSLHGIGGTATAQSAADVGIVFDTTGATRNGWLELSLTQNAWTTPVNGAISGSLSVGSFSAASDGGNLTSIWIPIQLGTQFGFDYVTNLIAIGSTGSGLTTGAIDTEITLQAFEADQTTGAQLFDPPGSPAGLLETPEPQGLGMLAGLASLGILFFIRQRRTPKNTFTR